MCFRPNHGISVYFMFNLFQKMTKNGQNMKVTWGRPFCKSVIFYDLCVVTKQSLTLATHREAWGRGPMADIK